MTWTIDHSLWNPDETRDAGIAAEMYRTGAIAVPTLNGAAFLEKPPLYYWTCALIYKLTGRVTAGTTRLPAALYGLLGLLFTFLIGRRLYGERVAMMATLMVATSLQYFRMSHFAMMDICLAAMVTGALYFYLRDSAWGFAIFTVLAFYAKGFLGILLPGLVVTLDLLITQQPKKLAKFVFIGAVVFVILAGPWFWALWKKGGDVYLHTFVIDNHWKRFFSSTADHTEHFWFFYFFSFPGDFFPWTLFFAGFLWSLFRQTGSYLSPGLKRFPIVWFFSILAFFCLSSSKRSIYLLPLFPAAALLSASWVDQAFPRTGARWVAGIGGALALILVVCSFTLVRKLDREKTFVPFCDEIKSHLTDKELVGFDLNEMERGVFGFYLRQTFKNPTDVGQLKEVIEGMKGRPFQLIVARSRVDDVAPVVTSFAKPIFKYRPDKKNRSYVLYSNVERGG